MDFTKEQFERYARNILLCNVGIEGQEKIAKGKVLIVGLGGLGSPAALYLAAAGVGTLGLADYDRVDISNLQRQVIHSTLDIGKRKVVSAQEKLTALNPDVRVIAHTEALCADNIAKVIDGYDFIIDGTDNFPAKFLINDACVLGKKPFSHAGVLRFDGQAFTHLPGTVCYRCVFAKMPPLEAVPSCSQAGILGPVAGMLGTIQALEALKYLIGKGELLTDRMLVVDTLAMKFREAKIKKDPACRLCGEKPSIKELFDEVPRG
jgi:adenylyltransferase/sulfurtransferase